VSAWSAAISARLEEWDRPVSLLELQESFAERPHGGIEMPLVQVWLALLLDGMTLEQRGNFYQIFLPDRELFLPQSRSIFVHSL
jgi:hypothetical protein